MSTAYIRVPEGMSYVNVLHALWKNEIPADYFFLNDETRKNLAPAEAVFSTPERVAAFFKEEFSKQYFNYKSWDQQQLRIDYAGGRRIKIFFQNFPYLDPTCYEELSGIGAAQRALNEYNRIPPQNRLDKNDQFKFSKLKEEIEEERLGKKPSCQKETARKVGRFIFGGVIGAVLGGILGGMPLLFELGRLKILKIIY